jgi:hypothetical protein
MRWEYLRLGVVFAVPAVLGFVPRRFTEAAHSNQLHKRNVGGNTISIINLVQAVKKFLAPKNAYVSSMRTSIFASV